VSSIDPTSGWALVAREVLPPALAGVWFRALPFVACALLMPRVPLLAKTSVALGTAVGTVIFVALDPRLMATVVDAAWAWSYMLLAAVVVHMWGHGRSWLRFTPLGLATACFTLFSLLPSLLIRNSVTLSMLALGFEVAFAAYSYVTEHQTGRGSTLGQSLMFLLVNPCLVYPSHGRQIGDPRMSRVAVQRLALGLAGQACAPLLSGWTSLHFGLGLAVTGSELGGLALVISAGVMLLHMTALYIGHSSLASLQIGAMRCLGWEIPERYHYPFLATGPDDFWRRWNRYHGWWLLRYVYLPLATRYQRRLPRRFWLVGKWGALMATFAACGLAHDAAGYALRLALPLGALFGFVIYGLMLGVWIGLTSWLSKYREAWVRLSPATGVLGRAVSWTAWLGMLLIFGQVALPALAGLGLVEPLRSWVSP
jgi:hypothetical protein